MSRVPLRIWVAEIIMGRYSTEKPAKSNRKAPGEAGASSVSRWLLSPDEPRGPLALCREDDGDPFLRTERAQKLLPHRKREAVQTATRIDLAGGADCRHVRRQDRVCEIGSLDVA